ncbi:MAG: hypothetical protein HC912_06610 [Saprospiraceae bacterium]|nr:hypothetical protein [Saprospiraceae bacterium]
MYDFYQEVIELNGPQTYSQNLTYFIHILCQRKQMEQLTEEDVLAGYDKIIAVVDANENNSTWQQVRDYVDRTLASCVTLDCNFVNNVLAPKIMNATKCDIGLAKTLCISYVQCRVRYR